MPRVTPPESGSHGKEDHPPMGIDVTALRALHVAARLYQVDFSKTVMLGRQVNYFTPRELASVSL
jgi:hypothetical protein